MIPPSVDVDSFTPIRTLHSHQNATLPSERFTLIRTFVAGMFVYQLARCN